MAKYTIAWMPGDGIGNDVMDGGADRPRRDEARRRVHALRHRLGFWCKEGNALPDRTVKACRRPPAASSARSPASRRTRPTKELVPELKDKGLVYFSPIVKLRQMFNLHTNMRPCKSYPGNPLNYRGTLISQSERRAK